MATSIEELCFDLTADALTEQERALTGLRMCAGTVLGAASVAGSFLGARAAHGSLGVWAVLGMLSFALCFGCAIRVLLPHDFVVGAAGQELLAVSDDRGVHDVTDAYRTAGGWLDRHLQKNRRTVARVSSWLSLSCILLAVEVALWTLSLAG
jgi:hypothetical protein